MKNGFLRDLQQSTLNGQLLGKSACYRSQFLAAPAIHEASGADTSGNLLVKHFRQIIINCT